MIHYVCKYTPLELFKSFRTRSPMLISVVSENL